MRLMWRGNAVAQAYALPTVPLLTRQGRPFVEDG
jgi:hypothetical protein